MPLRPVIETTGVAELEPLERKVQAQLDAVGVYTDSLPYEAANAADWSGSAPTTIAEALDRIAAALGPIA